jgi:hypothetical protein
VHDTVVRDRGESVVDVHAYDTSGMSVRPRQRHERSPRAMAR